MFKYDYIIKGAGCAGLSIAYYLNDSGALENNTLAIIENRANYERDKTWSVSYTHLTLPTTPYV